jgi:uncharacterized delta-60 repeat protein
MRTAFRLGADRGSKAVPQVKLPLARTEADPLSNARDQIVRIRCVALLSVALLLLAFVDAAASRAGAGEPDPSFGVGGVASYDLGFAYHAFPDRRFSVFHAIAIAPNGEIDAAGWGGDGGGNFEMLAARLTGSGSLDQSFGSGGSVLTTSEERSETALIDNTADAELERPDGTLVLAGYPGVAEVTSSGAAVPGYEGSSDSYTRALANLPGGDMLAAGTEDISSATQPAILRRLLPDGEADPTFGEGGVVELPVREQPSAQEEAYSMILEPSGKILLAGAGQYVANNTNVPFLWLMRCASNGAPDRTFGDDGVDYLEGRGEPALVKQPGGRLVLIGTVLREPGGAAAMRAWGFTPDGTPDATFGSAGTTTIAPLEPGGEGRTTGAAAVDSAGSVMIAGLDLSGSVETPVIARLQPSGELDRSYGSAGLARGGRETVFNALAVDAQDRTLAAGAFDPGQGSPPDTPATSIVERFLGDGGAGSTPSTGEATTSNGASASTQTTAGEQSPTPVEAAPILVRAEPRPSPSCLVPRLRGKTLVAARRLLAAAHCKLGRVGPSRRASHVDYVVRTQERRPGTRLPHDAAINVELRKRHR